MTREEYLAILSDLQEQERVIERKRANTRDAYLKTLNEPYNHLLNKKVKLTFRSGSDHIEIICYWGGYYANRYYYCKPCLYQLKKDGKMSSRRFEYWVDEIISIEEVL